MISMNYYYEGQPQAHDLRLAPKPDGEEATGESSEELLPPPDSANGTSSTKEGENTKRRWIGKMRGFHKEGEGFAFLESEVFV